MFNPRTILNKEGFRELQIHVWNLEAALFFLINNADDLHIGALDETQLETLINMNKLLEGGEDCLLLNGDGEELED